MDLHLPLSDRDAVAEVFDDLPLLGRFEEVETLGEAFCVCKGLVAGEELDAEEVDLPLEPGSLVFELAQALRREAEASLAMRDQQLIDRTNRLTDALLDGVLDKAAFDTRKEGLLKDRLALNEQRARLATDEVPRRVAEYLELAGTASVLYESSDPDIRRRMLEEITSNRAVNGRDVDLPRIHSLHRRPIELARRDALLTSGYQVVRLARAEGLSIHLA